ncbi:MAG: CHASE2 domain-containing protein [Treponema sp.]|nr:CHASE2 domain-containing protein [Treponema sp.]
MIKKHIACIIILFASACLVLTGIFNSCNTAFYDAALKFKDGFLPHANDGKDKQVIRIDINESAISQLPQGMNAWENLAQILSFLNEEKSGIFLPSFFAENAPANPKRKILGQMQMSSCVVLPAITVPNEIIPYLNADISLAQKKIIEKHLCYPRVLNGQKIAKTDRLLIPDDDFCRFATSLAFVCVPQDTDKDSVLRRMNVFYAYGDGYIPSFAFALASKMLGIKQDSIVLDCGNKLTFSCEDGSEYKVPVDGEGRILIPYSSKELFSKIDFEYFAQAFSDTDASYQINSMLKNKTAVITDSTFEKSRGSQNFFLSPLGNTITENSAELCLLNAFLENSFFGIYPVYAKYAILFFTICVIFFASLSRRKLTFFLACIFLIILIAAAELFIFVYMNIAPWIAGPIPVILAGFIFELIRRSL